MDAVTKSDVASAFANDWHSISWPDSFQNVRRLQTRIAKAAQHQDWRKLRRLQQLLH
jgi:hypothetical protein